VAFFARTLARPLTVPPAAAIDVQEVDGRVLGLPEGKCVVKPEPFNLPEPEYTDIF
jgi:hypothetical protein